MHNIKITFRSNISSHLGHEVFKKKVIWEFFTSCEGELIAEHQFW